MSVLGRMYAVAIMIVLLLVCICMDKEVMCGPCFQKMILYERFDHGGYAIIGSLGIFCCIAVVFDSECWREDFSVIEENDARIFLTIVSAIKLWLL